MRANTLIFLLSAEYGNHPLKALIAKCLRTLSSLPVKALWERAVLVDLAVRGKDSHRGDWVQVEGREPVCMSGSSVLSNCEGHFRGLTDTIPTFLSL